MSQFLAALIPPRTSAMAKKNIGKNEDEKNPSARKKTTLLTMAQNQSVCLGGNKQSVTPPVGMGWDAH